MKISRRFFLINAVASAAAMTILTGCMSTSKDGSSSDLTAIDICLEPDATMIQHAEAVNARLRGVFPEGFSLDATHHPHITMLQRFVRTADLVRIYAAESKVFESYKVTNFN